MRERGEVANNQEPGVVDGKGRERREQKRKDQTERPGEADNASDVFKQHDFQNGDCDRGQEQKIHKLHCRDPHPGDFVLLNVRREHFVERRHGDDHDGNNKRRRRHGEIEIRRHADTEENHQKRDAPRSRHLLTEEVPLGDHNKRCNSKL
eukprot:Amastigsp_a341491_30.p3 type:complete len:150 gc:universal Amastigsp_a341491_30:796-347(-)